MDAGAWDRYASDDEIAQEQTEEPAPEDKGIAEPVPPNEEAQPDETVFTSPVVVEGRKSINRCSGS